MKLFSIAFIALLFSPFASSTPLDWNDLETNQSYELAKEIWFNDQLKLSEKHPLQLVDVNADLDVVLFFVFKNQLCGDPEQKSDLILFNPEPEDNQHDKTIGVQILENCYVGMYVEPYYYYNKSVLLKKESNPHE